MAIPYQTAKFKSANIFAMAILGPTAKFNYRQYFQLYGMPIHVATHTHNYLGMAASDRDQSRNLRVLLGQTKPTILVILTICYLWLTYSASIQCLVHDSGV